MRLIDADALTGKTIMEAHVDGFGIELKLSDGSVFTYSASDAGYSSWEIERIEE